MKTNVFFVRHAQSDISVKDDMLRPLTPNGMADARLVADILRLMCVDIVYSSPYKRAYDTVNCFAKHNGIDIHMINDFRERKIGDVWIADFKEFAQKQWEDFDYKLENGESLREVQERNVKALSEILKKDMGRNIVVGSHGTALSTIINYFRPVFGFEDFWAIKDKMPYIMCFTFDGTELVNMEEVQI